MVESFFVSPGNGARGTTALVVNTDTRVLQGFASALRGEGYSVLEATSFEDGKQLWTATKPDVLVVDIRLGQFNGLQLLMRARSDRPDLHAIITCPFADAVLEAETRRFGGTFLIRPIEPQQIVSSIRQIQSPDAAPPMPLLERRRSDRRKLVIADFHPERRTFNRRAPLMPTVTPVDRTRPTEDQRNGVKPEFDGPGTDRRGIRY